MMSMNPDHPYSDSNAGSSGFEYRRRQPPDIECYNVGLRYPGGQDILRNVNFALPHGSFHFLTGPSGAGKSSLLKLIYLALSPSRGQLRLFGHDPRMIGPAQLPLVKRLISVVFQEFRLLDHLSVVDNVALPVRIAGRRPRDYMHDVVELLRWVGLGNHLHAFPATLSGEKNRG